MAKKASKVDLIPTPEGYKQMIYMIWGQQQHWDGSVNAFATRQSNGTTHNHSNNNNNKWVAATVGNEML